MSGINTDVLSAGSTRTAADYLAVTSLTNDIFLIGLLDSGVTIFNQQIRALNLIWALDRADRLSSASAIAVVGGGIAGLTAAMALREIFSLTAGSSPRTVTLFERRSVLCPLQRGCATRWVHPHIYDWPAAGSTNPSAGLPIMNWRAGRASDVATTIVTQWEDEPAHKAVDVKEWRNLQYLKIHHNSREVEWVGEQYEGGRQLAQVRGDKRPFDIIILAIGFGDERDSTKHRAVSYWRNETYAQPGLSGRQQRHLVSGTGDGGLVDLLRLRITDFREDRIGPQLAPEGSEPYKAIQQLRATCYSDPSTQGAALFDQARELGGKHHLIDTINRRLRADTVASLQIHTGQRVSDAFRGKSSFVNRFLVSLLFEAGGFSPQFGDLDLVDADDFDGIIVRHGAKTDAHVKNLFSEDISVLLADLEKKRIDQKAIIDTSQREGLWEPGWPLNKKAGPGPGSSKRDYVPEATIAVSSAFVSALAPVFSTRGRHYRATLHRIVGMDAANEVHLQQIAHYHGPRAATKSADKVVGRLFKITDAVIGLAARSRRVLTTRPSGRPDGECKALLRKDMQLLNGDSWDPQRMDDDVSALFACPLVYVGEDVADPAKAGKVVAVLFADSTEAAAFGEDTVAQIVVACEEFGRYLQRIARSEARELVSVKSQAMSYFPAESAAPLFNGFSLLTASPTSPPHVPVEYINLDWWT
jgi:hypothetical protein